MPLVRISVVKSFSDRYAAPISDSVHDALTETFNVPAADRFQTISVHEPKELVFPAEYLGIQHSSSIVLIQITCNEGRTLEMKKALYARIAELIASRTSIGKNDVFINLVEVKKENWSFGDGIAQYA